MYEAPRTAQRFSLLRTGNAEEKQTPRQRTSKYFNWSPSYKSVKYGGKMKICEKYQTFEEIE